MEDSFGDLLDNDTSERHIVVQNSPPKYQPPTKKQEENVRVGRGSGGKTQQPQNLMQAQLYQARLEAMNSSAKGNKASVAKPLPGGTAAATPGEKSARSGNKENGFEAARQLKFLDHQSQEDSLAYSAAGHPGIERDANGQKTLNKLKEQLYTAYAA